MGEPRGIRSRREPTDHVPELFRSEGELAAQVGTRADRLLVHTSHGQAEFATHTVQMRRACWIVSASK
jgi:hypothetical protein